jgi:hypothetical protein
MVNIQGCHQSMYIITGNKITFRLIISQHGTAKEADRLLQLNELRNICCTRIAENILRPAFVLVHGIAAKIKL